MIGSHYHPLNGSCNYYPCGEMDTDICNQNDNQEVKATRKELALPAQCCAIPLRVYRVFYCFSAFQSRAVQ